MARHYYLTRSGRLRRKDNTLCFEPAADETENETPTVSEEEIENSGETVSGIGDGLSADLLGNLDYDAPDALDSETTLADILDGETDAPVRVKDRRTIPVEDVDAIWSFRELDLNSKVLNFLAQKKIPVHFFNYYGFYSGSFYPREYLQAGFLLVKQVKHYSSSHKRLAISRELIGAALHNILRNLRYRDARGTDLLIETEAVQTEVLRLNEVKDIGQLMACEGRARAAYYKAFEKIIKRDVEFKKRVRRPPDNMVNALISFTNGLVYSSDLLRN